MPRRQSGHIPSQQLFLQGVLNARRPRLPCRSNRRALKGHGHAAYGRSPTGPPPPSDRICHHSGLLPRFGWFDLHVCLSIYGHGALVQMSAPTPDRQPHLPTCSPKAGWADSASGSPVARRLRTAAACCPWLASLMALALIELTGGLAGLSCESTPAIQGRAQGLELTSGGLFHALSHPYPALHPAPLPTP